MRFILGPKDSSLTFLSSSPTNHNEPKMNGWLGLEKDSSLTELMDVQQLIVHEHVLTIPGF